MSHAVQLKRRQLSFTCIWINLQLSFKTVLQICNILKFISLPGMSDALKKLLNSLNRLLMVTYCMCIFIFIAMMEE